MYHYVPKEIEEIYFSLIMYHYVPKEIEEIYNKYCLLIESNNGLSPNAELLRIELESYFGKDHRNMQHTRAMLIFFELKLLPEEINL